MSAGEYTIIIDSSFTYADRIDVELYSSRRNTGDAYRNGNWDFSVCIPVELAAEMSAKGLCK